MASEDSIGARTAALVEQGDFERALELLERERKGALSRGDAASMESVFAAVKLVHARAHGTQQSQADRISFAAQQNIRYLGRQAALTAGEEWIDPFASSRPKTVAATEPKGSLFGGPRRLRAHVVAAVSGIATFPLWWFVFMFGWGLGSDSGGVATARPPDGGIQAVRENVLVAAGFAAATTLAAVLLSVRAGRRCPRSERIEATRRETLTYAVAVLVAFGAAAGLFAFFWIDTPLRAEFSPYTSR
jgi:hypothetical protein